MKEAKKIAYCSMAAALGVVLMIIGSIAGLGMYAAPLFAGVMIAPIGERMGRKYHALVWIVTSLLSFILVANWEQNLMYACLFGCYPIIRPFFERLKGWLKLAAKLAYFNIIVVALEALVMLVLVPESMGAAMLVVLLIMGNLVFICYDFLVPRADVLMRRLLGRIKK